MAERRRDSGTRNYLSAPESASVRRSACYVTASEFEGTNHEPGSFGTDTPYREATIEFERHCGRHPEAKDPDQAGHDLDAFDRLLDDPKRKLVCRIEVKG